MAMFDPAGNDRYREITNQPTNSDGISLNLRYCSICKNRVQIAGGKYIRGTSRHNPGRFICKDCKC